MVTPYRPSEMRNNSVRTVRGESQAGVRLPLLQRLLQPVGEKANYNMRLDPLFLVKPDRADAQIGFVNAEGGLDFAQLNVGLHRSSLAHSPILLRKM